MQRQIILITGCQRSGTTLLHLILDSHPENTGINENDFRFHHFNSYLYAPHLPPHVSFKLPRYAPIFPFIRGLPGLKLLWCIRNPLDVIYSMITLKIAYGRNMEIAWAAHPETARAEIYNCYWVLSDDAKRNLARHMNEYQQVAAREPMECGRRELIYSAALCWRIKNELALEYPAAGFQYHAVRYEELVSNPQDTIRATLDYVGLPWHDDVLRHHELHDGLSSGKTDCSKPITTDRLGGGMKYFFAEDLNLITDICGDLPERWGYSIKG